ncbi:SDR family oxidoreductase [Streptomyces flaveolus]|uniref:SDR family oxidoreductase n=1 Tax=Streptomyces flaveolus TaxID=67297 RepID=UPI0033F8AE5F
MADDRRALVVGVTGIAGNNVARRLVEAGWQVYGVSRGGGAPVAGVNPVRADVMDAAGTSAALADLRPTHLFFCSWQRQPTEAENVRVNGAMLKNVLEPLVAQGSLRHAALVTGLKHYLGPFESYAKTPMETPFREEQPRLPGDNFYYTQEDLLFDAAERGGFTWSVHRPHTMIGWALGNLMNMGVTLAVYGALCRETGEPFVFPGSPQQYHGITDLTDARLLARQLEWAATSPAAANQAFNTVNGDVFRWRQMWPVVAAGLGVEPAEYPEHARPLEQRFADAGPVWDRVVKKYDLRPHALEHIASWWHTDGDLGREAETFADMNKSRAHGFLESQDSRASFLDLFEELRRERIIPPLA